jgi:hypothetical protein
MSRSRLATLLRYAWASPASVLGLAAAAAACATGATARRVDGVLEVAGGELVRRLGNARACRRFSAVTLGHVVLGTSHAVLDAHRAHEHEHVRQYERWGLFFFAGYFASSAVQWLSGRDAYWHNSFERSARAAARRAQSAASPQAAVGNGRDPGSSSPAG